MMATRPSVPFADPVCVQDGNLRAYIWPAKQQYVYEVVDSDGQRLSVGAADDLSTARKSATLQLSRMRYNGA